MLYHYSSNALLKLEKFVKQHCILRRCHDRITVQSLQLISVLPHKGWHTYTHMHTNNYNARMLENLKSVAQQMLLKSNAWSL